MRANLIVTLARDHALGRSEHGRWVSTLPVAAWDGFESELRAPWPERVDERGFPDAFLEVWLDRVRRDAFAAAAARRAVGLAHVVDLESLEPGARAAASRGVIATVERLLLERDELGSAEAVAAVAGEEIARAA